VLQEHVPQRSQLPEGLKELASDALTGEEQVSQVGENNREVRVSIPIQNGQVIEGVVVLQGMGLERHFGNVTRLWLNSALLSLMIMSLAALFFSRSIAKPLQEMSEVARQMARGDFSRKVRVTSCDEVGELAQAFNQMADELAMLESMRREFVANASHELRSPLTSIRGFVGAILDGTIPLEGQRPFLERIHRETERLGQLVDELLDLSALENETEQGARPTARVSLVRVVEQAAGALEGLIREKGLVLHLQLEEADVRGEQERLVRAVINLLSNAIRFSHPGGPITIRTGQQGERGFVEICDEGIGIPAEDLGRVWERFYKVDRARSAGTGGTGLGLPIARRLIEAYGGEVGLTSTLGEGTCARFTLPLF
jgi:signal transduction histidine kinase